MKHGLDLRRARETAVLVRMQVTREQLCAADRALRAGSIRRPATRDARNPRALTVTNVAHALYDAPRVTLLGSIVLASLMLGPKRVVPLVVRTGLTSWVSRNVRALVGRN
ncbi:hypothetical protein E1N52_04655 [Paraburkholderia guartelaensis]|uniref:YqjK-like protein n=1 Tax=Paraburkholderia guartelaensis TaxID=2546446 RepID=A0A4R5LJI6_9BURK|nr:hypothetical protein [Paraburkholderia guartelaensis]TDG09816.1 hypothetical protein E1N52_04655 [Paraburkholderia guartelaensis]